ncbi:MAG: transketolase family protein [bacterium]|nr:transketolase family protein [bacterium]
MNKELNMKPTRHGYGEALVELGKEDERIYVLGADLTSSTSADLFQKAFPERFVEIGIAEQNMLNVAAGLALEGKIPFVSTYGVFVAGRAWDQIRTTICYGNINVKIGGAHGGISVGPDGATHQALEEITIMRVIPNMQVVVPCDYWETFKATKYIAQKINGPSYIRFGREAVPIITEKDTPFEYGKAQTFREGKDVAIIACGMMVYWALEAAKELKKEGIDVMVVNNHTIKPIDKDGIIAAAKKTGAVVTAEEHQILGGLGGAVAEVLGQNYPVPMRIVGVQDRFGESGDPWELLEEFGLTTKYLVKAAKDVIKMKK